MKAQELAYLIINFAIKDGCPVSNLALQKLMYVCQLAHYRVRREQLITDQEFEAWDFGPVVRVVYVEFCLFGSNPISRTFEVASSLPSYLCSTVRFWLYKNTWELIKFSHREEGAWSKIFKPGFKLPIPEEMIREEAELYGAVDI